MRIGILTQYYPPEIGAPQRRLSQLARAFQARGHQTLVLTGMPNYPTGHIYEGYGGLMQRGELDGIHIVRSAMFATKNLRVVPRLASYFSFVVSSAAVGSTTLPSLDYLITESPPLFLGITGYWLSRLKLARWIFNVADLWPESAVQLGVIRDGWLLRRCWSMEARCYRKAWLVTGQSREILDSINTRFPGTPTLHLPNGVDTEKFSPRERSAAVREWLAPGAECIALYAGLHGLAQGLDQILEAAAILRDRSSLRFVFVGDGPKKRELKEKAAARELGNVRFLDPRCHEDMPALVSSADVALVTLDRALVGAVPSKLYEAMGAGIPIVLAGCGEAAAIVRRTAAGIVVDPGDVRGLATALARLADDPESRATFGSAGRRAAQSSFDSRATADRFVDFLESELEARRAS